jgi:radical SAM protein with 4Fe4S-binding SPASM domain
MATKSLYVGNLSYSTNESSLTELFAPYGGTNVRIIEGRGFAFIDHLGDVYPSGFLPHRCGNVTEQGFREIYRTSPLLRALRDPSALTGACGSCDFAEVCGGSRSHAYAVTGDLFADDPTCVAGSAGTSSCQA